VIAQVSAKLSKLSKTFLEFMAARLKTKFLESERETIDSPKAALSHPSWGS
jgi:hypothetical protein